MFSSEIVAFFIICVCLVRQKERNIQINVRSAFIVLSGASFLYQIIKNVVFYIG